ncbi:MAG: ABC transporter transmembrane domain-containing protein, partial [Alphaproteobacteria bacterium]|nr:ABC transporter transmembrane domain-containing protein [Alphaproteobacteria bacterium]
MLQFLKKHETRKLVSRLMREFIAPYTPKLMLALVFMILVALATAALAYMIKPIIDNGFAHPKLDILLWACAAVFLTFVVKGGASYGESVVMTFVGQRIISDIQNCLFKHIMRLDLAYFHNTPSGELLSRFTNDVNMMRNAMENTLLNLGKDLILLVSLLPASSRS